MKYLTTTLLILFSTISVGQITSGEYNPGLKLAFDKKTNKVTVFNTL